VLFFPQIVISVDLGYVGKESFQEIREAIGDVERMLKAMIKSLENKQLVDFCLDRKSLILPGKSPGSGREIRGEGGN